jgi:hypothetical protein
LLQSKQAATKQFDLAAKQPDLSARHAAGKISQILIATKPAVFTKKKQLIEVSGKTKAAAQIYNIIFI